MSGFRLSPLFEHAHLSKCYFRAWCSVHQEAWPQCNCFVAYTYLLPLSSATSTNHHRRTLEGPHRGRFATCWFQVEYTYFKAGIILGVRSASVPTVNCYTDFITPLHNRFNRTMPKSEREETLAALVRQIIVSTNSHSSKMRVRRSCVPCHYVLTDRSRVRIYARRARHGCDFTDASRSSSRESSMHDV